MALLDKLFALALIVFRIGIPIYLYLQARDRRWRKAGLWVLFGFFEPIVALMIFYVVIYVLPSGNLSKG